MTAWRENVMQSTAKIVNFAKWRKQIRKNNGKIIHL